MPADNTDELGTTESDQIISLRNELEEKNEELRVWRLRCMQAEAEVRALKRGTKHAALSLSASQADNEDTVQNRLVPKLEASAQTEESNLEQKPPAGPFAAAGVSEVLNIDHSQVPAAKSEEIEELRHQLQIKNSTIIQLQADMIREQHVRDKQTSEKQRRASESQQICREELREMTQRAESLSEQVRKSKKKTQELQAARESYGDECTRVRSELELCEERLRTELSVKSELQCEQDTLKAELTSWKFSENLSEGKEEAAQKTPDVIDSPRGRHGKLLQCIQSLRQMHSDISKELQSNSKRASRPVTGKGSTQNKQSVDEVLHGILKQLEKVQQVAIECNESHREPATARIILSAGFDDQANSPEHERPVPETTLYLKDRKQILPSGKGSDLPALRDEVVQGRLDINDLRLELETQREKLITDHCEELDDLVRRHDQERQVLYSEAAEWRVRFTKLQAEASVAQPILEMQHYFETQVSVVRQELVAQLADIQERQSVQRGHEVQQLADLRHCLERCQTELSASQHEFRTLATLFEKERQRSILKLQQQERDLVQEATHELAESGVTPVPSEPANMATLASTRDFCPDEEATVATDMLSIFAAAGALVAQSASGSASQPVLKQPAPRVTSSSSVSMLRGAVPQTQNRPISPEPSKSASPTSSMSSVAAAASATQMRKLGTGQSPASLLQYTDRHSLTT